MGLKIKKLIMLLLLPLWVAKASYEPEFSTAGFFAIPNSGREVFSMNVAWRFHKGAVAGAEQKAFDDSQWPVVSIPHGIEYLPTEASGCYNYQGEVWYRKTFRPDVALKGKKLFLHFEAIMGKSKIWINGHLVKEQFGGFLPAIADITQFVDFSGDNVVSVWADNSNDPLYPPGKPQETLDFSYFGGIYRDCWLVAHNHLFITDPNYENAEAGGGLFVAFNGVSEKRAGVTMKLHLRNAQRQSAKGTVEFQLSHKDGSNVAFLRISYSVQADGTVSVNGAFQLKNPNLWSPESPYLYNLTVQVKDAKGKVVDGYRRRIGIRGIEFKGKDGFWLNGKPYPNPLIGANRHQDFAVVGNALANSIHWRDAKKLRDVGLKVIRNAHYPQDPAFMDACDELGLFVIVNTPGWQFWNENPIFAQRVYSDIRNMVRRDRNHASVWLWEPILNETWYPADFAKNTHDIVLQEYPYPYCYSGCDAEARGAEIFPVQFSHPRSGDVEHAVESTNDAKTYFTREWGDNVDDWNSHNSPSRVNKVWGEVPMLVQANHYAKPPYQYSTYDALFRTSRQHVGGCLWHSFDHQRGYHPDPFYGGIMDVFRQPKYAYYMFMSQRSPQKTDILAETGPMVHIAHEMTPFSPADVTVFSNCDSVRLTVFEHGEQHVLPKQSLGEGMPHPIFVFKDVYDFMNDKALSRKRKQAEVYLLAEGLIGGKVVATHKVAPARRAEKLLLWVDDEGVSLKADGSDFVTVVAAMADKDGNIKRLNNHYVVLSIEGEGRLLGDASVMANPRPIEWGTAPVLVQASTKAGKIKVKASVVFKGSQMPLSADLELTTQPALVPMVYREADLQQLDQSLKDGVDTSKSSHDEALQREIEKLRNELNRIKLHEVEKQQEAFGEQN